MKKPKNWDRRDAEAFLIQMLYTIGTGFHPDTDPMDYVYTDENGVRCCTFTDGKEIKRMREGIARAREFFPSDEVELYQFLNEWQERIYPGSTLNSGDRAQSVALIFGERAIVKFKDYLGDGMPREDALAACCENGEGDYGTYTFSTNKDINEALAMIEDVAAWPNAWEQIECSQLIS